MISNPWVIGGAGVFFCISGVFFFFKNIFEENRSIRGALFIMILGVVLIALASYQYMQIKNS